MSERRAEELGPVPRPGQGADAHAPDGRPLWAPTGAGTGDVAHDEQPPESRRSRQERDGGRSGRTTAWSWIRETAIILVSALVLSLVVKTFLVQAFFIPSPSMHDTLVENDRILVSKLTPGPRDLRRGDIVVFKDPGGWLQPVVEPQRGPLGDALNDGLTWIGLLPQDAGEHLVKRVIGLPGDRVAGAPGQPVTVNGVPLEEPYLATGAEPTEKAFDVTVPEGSVWVMGDNRQRSADSRYNMGNPGGGSVPVDNIVGVAFVTVWPLDRATVLRNPSDTFAGVPDPS
ncbi:signal peptidase I [Cellulomonas sp. 179-A 9B4 NHS]|uniref:signal peptidase I n=1 Tax=Cellulomonas sp. 179-A 9B4 NHS TaxID=3142379 RepID=UPI00399EF35A